MPFPSSRKHGLATASALGLAAVALGGAWLARPATFQSTDDAYVQADAAPVSPRIAGQITQVLVEDNQIVKAGQVLARIDDADYRAALAGAQADVAAAKGELADLNAQIARHPAMVAQAAATLHADEAALDFADANAGRYRQLSQEGAGTRQDQQQADSTLARQRALREGDRAALTAAGGNLPILQAGRAKAQAALARAQAALDQAQLNLSYTQIRAPIDGMVGQRTLRPGAIVAAGMPLLSVVPLRNAYVLAHFQENQLAHMHPGQSATIRIDSLPGVTLRAHVDSLAPATGTAYAPIAPDNATGNFTKVVQRLPVKLTIDPGQSEAALLHVGLSVVPSVHVGGAR